MRAWMDFECPGCGLFLPPTFEIARAECCAGCGADFWVCLGCIRRPGGVPCDACRPAVQARREAQRQEREERKHKREIEAKMRAPMDPML